MIDVRCLACDRQTSYDGVVTDMIDVVCPTCACRTRLVAVPVGLEPREEVTELCRDDDAPSTRKACA